MTTYTYTYSNWVDQKFLGNFKNSIYAIFRNPSRLFYQIVKLQASSLFERSEKRKEKLA